MTEERRSFLPWVDVSRIGRLALPAIFAMLTQTFVNIVDTWFLKALPDPDRTDGQSMLTTSLVMLWGVGGFFAAISTGTLTIVARRRGEGDDKAAGATMWNAVVLAAGVSAIVAALGYFAVPSVFKMLSSNANYVRLGSDYTQWRFVGIVPMVMTAAYKSFFDGTSRTYMHLLAAIVMNIVNVVLCWLFIFGNMGAPALGVEGAGIAAAISSWFGLLFMIGFTFLPSEVARYAAYKGKLSASLMRELAYLSVPSGLATSVVMLGVLVFRWVIDGIDAAYIASGGTETVNGAATTIIIQILSITFFACLALGVATASLVSQHLGAKEPKRAEDIAWTSVKLGVIVFGVVGLVQIVAPGALIGVFNNSSEVLRVGAPVMRMMGICTPLVAIAMVLTQALFGAGNTKYVMYVEAGLHFGLLVPGSLLVHYMSGGLIHVWMVAVVYVVLLAFFMTAKFRKGDWKDIAV
jgi:MATE family multidrug resistance protein